LRSKNYDDGSQPLPPTAHYARGEKHLCQIWHCVVSNPNLLINRVKQNYLKSWVTRLIVGNKMPKVHNFDRINIA